MACIVSRNHWELEQNDETRLSKLENINRELKDGIAENEQKQKKIQQALQPRMKNGAFIEVAEEKNVKMANLVIVEATKFQIKQRKIEKQTNLNLVKDISKFVVFFFRHFFLKHVSLDTP